MEVTGAEALRGELGRLAPAEVLFDEDSRLPAALGLERGVTRRPAWHFDRDSGERLLCAQFGSRNLTAFGCAALPLAVGAAGCLLQYVKDTQRAALPHIQGLTTESRDEAVILDAATRRNLEIERSLAERSEACLAGVMDQTVTAMGSRLLRRWLARPLRDIRLVRQRHAAIAELLEGEGERPLREELAGMGDLERILARVALGSARPRDLAVLRDSLARLPALQALLAPRETPLLQVLAREAGTHPQVVDLLRRALIENPPALIRDGGVLAGGYDPELDELRDLSTNADRFLLELEARERERSGLANLRVTYNRVHGYAIEVSRSQADQVPADYVRRQTLKGAERYVTPELKRFEDQVLSARERSLAREKALYEALLEQLRGELSVLQTTATAVATLDVLANLAERARRLDWCRPELTTEPVIDIKDGRHPVVEAVSDRPFVANDVRFDPERRMLVVTGPNMGGKSTYMRQTALIVLMALAGSYRPRRRRPAGAGGPHLLAHRRLGRPGGRAFHLHGGDGGDGTHPPQRHRAQSGTDGRDRPGHQYLRRPVPGLGLRGRTGGADSGLHPLRHPLFRADHPARRTCRYRQRPPGRSGIRGQHRLPARRARGPSQPELRPPGRQPGRGAQGRHRPRPPAAAGVGGCRPAPQPAAIDPALALPPG